MILSRIVINVFEFHDSMIKWHDNCRHIISGKFEHIQKRIIHVQK